MKGKDEGFFGILSPPAVTTKDGRRRHPKVPEIDGQWARPSFCPLN